MNNDKDIDNYKVDCKDLENENDDIRTFWKRMEKNLKALSWIIDKDVRNDECFYFQHRFYDEQRKKFCTGNILQNERIFDKLIHIITSINRNHLVDAHCGCYITDTGAVERNERFARLF